MTNSQKSLMLLLGLLMSLLSACSQPITPPPAPPTVPPTVNTTVDIVVEIVDLDSANVDSVQLLISGPVEQTYLQEVTGDAAEFPPVTLPYDDYTFTARGFSGAAAGGVVLYNTSRVVSIGEDSAKVPLRMARTTGNLAVRVGGVAANETVVASAGGVTQTLLNAGDGSATGTLQGVATGEQVFVSAEAKGAEGAVVKQGRSDAVALSEAEQSVSFSLTAVAAGNAVPDSVTLAVAPSAPVAGSPVTLSISATDPDGAADLADARIDWQDGGTLQTQALTNGAASVNHTYAAAGEYTVTVTVYDRAAASKSATLMLTVASATPTDTPKDTTAPTVDVTFSGATDANGAYKDAAKVTLTATDAGGSGLASVSYSLDGGASKPYTGPVTVSAPGAHTVTAKAEDGARNVTTTPVQSFTVVASPTSLGALELQNLDGAPFADRLTFNRIGSLSNPPTNGVHDLVTLRLKNSGSEALTLSGLSLNSTDWQLENAPSLPTTLAAGSQLDLRVRFVAETSRKIHNGTLTITSNDATPQRIVQLAGWWQLVSENNQEPNLQKIVETFDYKTVITTKGQVLNQKGLFTAVGDEVLSPYWRRADLNQPVKVQQLAAFHRYPDTAAIFWYPKGTSTKTTILTHAGQDAQALLPRKNNSASLAVNSFVPSSEMFGFGVANEFSDWRKNDGQIDLDNGCAGVLPQDCGHHVRFWPAKDRSGTPIADTYIMAMDYAGINYDFNDNVYLISNVTPDVQSSYRLNVAGGAYTDTRGNAWNPDSGFYLPKDAISEGGITRDILSTDDDTLYQTYRAFLPNKPTYDNRVLVYHLPVPAGDYDLKLHFAEIYWDAPGKRVFDIVAEGVVLQDNFDILTETDKFGALIKTFKVHVTDGMLTLRLKAEVDFGALSALELVPAGTVASSAPTLTQTSPTDAATLGSAFGRFLVGGTEQLTDVLERQQALKTIPVRGGTTS